MDTEPAHCPVSAPEAGDHCRPFAWWNWLLPCGQNPAYTAPFLIRGTRGAGLPGFWVHGGHPHPLRDTCFGQCQLLQDGLTHHPLCLAARGASGWRGSPGCPPLRPSPTATAGGSPRTRLPPGSGSRLTDTPSHHRLGSQGRSPLATLCAGTFAQCPLSHSPGWGPHSAAPAAGSFEEGLRSVCRSPGINVRFTENSRHPHPYPLPGQEPSWIAEGHGEGRREGGLRGPPSWF